METEHWAVRGLESGSLSLRPSNGMQLRAGPGTGSIWRVLSSRCVKADAATTRPHVRLWVFFRRLT